MSSPPPLREVVAIGDEPLIAGFGLAGVRLYPAATAAEAEAAWQAVSRTAAVVILTRGAADAVAEVRTASEAPLTVVMPT